MIKKPIKGLSELEKMILRYHIFTYPNINAGLPLNIFPHIPQNDVHRALLKLLEYGYYKRVRNLSHFPFTDDGYLEARSFFKKGLRGLWNRLYFFIRFINRFWFAHWKWIIGITANIALGLLAIYYKCPDK